ncbi:TFIIB-type zinc ribbon-containing protein [Actinophytocola sp.]|uniref:TFIIB-type zinc ribbon-containing protein n=1 Tax=Actinophytocola sp. TaxID=1872138 RepID=UPI002D7F1609|nr:TFIIB-type zinc ribbon-containing protein [Actinophytocola sp.]HET9144278.1 TFIIB-type zinc ribbon-containing protein [Actinophytocola sp.]
MSTQRGGPQRFRDPLIWLEMLARRDIHVVCPRCAGRAVDVPRSAEQRVGPRRLVCGSCGYTADTTPRSVMWRGPVDPYFHVPLWLQAQCCGGETLWALNEEHLDLLEGYVGAKLRERQAFPGSMTMVARLPVGMKSAKHRDEVLRTIGRLRASLR